MKREKVPQRNKIRRLYKAATGKTLTNYKDFYPERWMAVVDELMRHVDALREETLQMLDM